MSNSIFDLVATGDMMELNPFCNVRYEFSNLAKIICIAVLIIVDKKYVLRLMLFYSYLFKR